MSIQAYPVLFSIKPILNSFLSASNLIVKIQRYSENHKQTNYYLKRDKKDQNSFPKVTVIHPENIGMHFY